VAAGADAVTASCSPPRAAQRIELKRHFRTLGHAGVLTPETTWERLKCCAGVVPTARMVEIRWSDVDGRRARSRDRRARRAVTSGRPARSRSVDGLRAGSNGRAGTFTYVIC